MDDIDDDVFALSAMEHEQYHESSTGITTKIPPQFDGQTSWFQYEDLIDDWIDLTTLENSRHGPALKNRLCGEAAVYKTLLDRDILKTAGGVQQFKDVLRPNFVKGTQSIFLWHFSNLFGVTGETKIMSSG